MGGGGVEGGKPSQAIKVSGYTPYFPVSFTKRNLFFSDSLFVSFGYEILLKMDYFLKVYGSTFMIFYHFYKGKQLF